MKNVTTENINKALVLAIVTVIAFILAMFGITYAFFSITVSGNEEASSVVVNVVDLGTVTFADGDLIGITDAIYPMLPEERLSKEFTITSANNEADIDYMIYMTVTANNFLQQYEHEFTYTLNGVSNNGGVVTTGVDELVPTVGKHLIGTGKLKTGGDTHTYTFTIGLNEVGSNQNSNQNKTFEGVLSVETKKYTQDGSIWGE